MGSKIFLVLGLALALILVISSETAARDLAKDVDSDGAHGIEDNKYGTTQWGGGGGGGGHYGGGGGGGHYGGGGGGGHYGGGGGGGYRGRCFGYCRYGCCRYGCCRYAGEAETEAQPHN